MNKTIFSSTSLVITALLLLSCSGYQQEAKRYQVEKTFFEAEKLTQSYSVKPELRTAQDYFNLVAGYRKVYTVFLELFPDLAGKSELTKTEQEAAILAGKALTTAADMLVSGDQYDSALTMLEPILTKDFFAPRHRNEALMQQGKIAEQQSRWLDAEKSYLRLLEAYYPPVLNRIYPAIDVIEIPRGIVDHYLSSGDTTMAMQKADWAVRYYQGIIDTLPHTPVALISTRLLAELYNTKGDYQRSVTLLQTVIDSTGNVIDAARGMIADLYLTRLDRKNDAFRIYQELMDEGTDSVAVASTYMKMATVEFKDKRYPEGRQYLEKLTERYPRYINLLTQAQMLKAQSFEEGQEYDRAKQEYVNLVTEYPTTAQAIEVYAYFPEFYKKIGQPDLAKEWVTKSEEKLKALVRDNPNNRIGLMASSYLGTFYIRNRMLDQAINQFQQLRQQFPKSTQAADALLKIGLIYQLDKKDNAMALSIYRNFLKQYPNSVVRQKIEEEVKRLEKS
jgi:tetratricopeptide (TPR) repeat protein